MNINKMPEYEQAALVKENPHYLNYIKTPSRMVRSIGLKGYFREASHRHKKMTLAEQVVAVTQDPHYINYIDNPAEAVQLAAVKESGYAIAHIDNQSEAAQLVAVDSVGEVIEYIKNPSEKVQLHAMWQNKNAYGYISNPCAEAQGLIVEYLYNMKLFEAIEVNPDHCMTRLPGGWIYSNVFIPYISKKELKETLFNQG